MAGEKMSSLTSARWWQASTPFALLTLLLNNLIPLLGVLFLGWELYPIILIYWIENGVVGLFNALKMAFAQGQTPTSARETQFREWLGPQNLALVQLISRIFFIGFFLIHYGIFWTVHGVFVQTLFSEWSAFGSRGNVPMGASPFGMFSSLSAVIGARWGIIGAMIVSHGSSFVQNYIGRGEYTIATPAKLMSEPYGRVVVLHVTILVGSILVASLGEPFYGLLLLIGLKTAVDLWAHLREHRRYHPAA